METTTAQASACTAQTHLEALVAAHLDLVYSAALRQVRDPHLAEDVSQNVFLIAARKTGELPPERMAAWLLMVTRYVALSTLRAERRRRKHERAAAITPQTMETQTLHEAHEAVESKLDEALTALGKTDRELIILRFVQSYSVPQVAAALGITDNTASKRIGRALDRLRNHFRRRGVHIGGDALGAVIVATALRPAPKALGAQILGASTTTAIPAFASTSTFGVLLMTASTKLNIIVGAALLVLLLLGGSYTILHFSTPPSSSTGAQITLNYDGLRNFFPNGGKVEFVAVNSSVQPNKWWDPDGSPLSQGFSGADFSSLKDPYGETRATYQFAIRLTNLVNNPESIYLQVSGCPRTAPQAHLQQARTDLSLFYGAALLYPEQVETSWVSIAYSTLPWNKITLDTTGKPQPPLPKNLPPDKQYLSHLVPIMPFNRVHEKDGKSILDIGMEIWVGDYEFNVVAIAKDGSSHPASNLLTGLITGGDNYHWAFDLPPSDIQRFEISIRAFDQFALFANLSLQPGQKTRPEHLDYPGRGGTIYFDNAFYNQLFGTDLGENIRVGNIPAATHAAAELIAQLNTRRTHLQAKNSPDLYLVGKALPIVTQIHDALEHNDLATATALLQADTASGRCLQNALQKLALNK